MKKQEQKGTITVFLAVNFLVIIALLGTLIDGARVAAANVQLYRANTLATNSVLAQYNTKLKDKYGLYAYMGNEEEIANYILSQNMDLVTRQGESNFENIVSGGLDYITGKPNSLFNTVQMQLVSSKLGEPVTLLDQDEFKRQILEYSKFRVPLDWVDNRQGLIEEFKEAIEQVEQQIAFDKKVKETSLKAIEVQEKEVALNETTQSKIPLVQGDIKEAWKDLEKFVSNNSGDDYGRQYLEELLGDTTSSDTPIFVLKNELSQVKSAASEAAGKIDKLKASKESLKDFNEKQFGAEDKDSTVAKGYKTDLDTIERTIEEHTSTGQSLENTSKQYTQLSEKASGYASKVDSYISDAKSCLEKLEKAEEMPEETEEQQLKKEKAIEKAEADIAKFADKFSDFIEDDSHEVITDEKTKVKVTQVGGEELSPEEESIMSNVKRWPLKEEEDSDPKHTKSAQDQSTPYPMVDKKNIFEAILDKFIQNKPELDYAIDGTDTKEYEEAEKLTQNYKNGDESSDATSTDEEEGISDKEINPFWNVLDGIKANMVEGTLDVTDKPILVGYAIKSFSNHLCRLEDDSDADVDIASYKQNFRGKEKQGFFDDCEIEYLIKGQASEQKNLEYVKGELTGWCGLFNYICGRRVKEINRVADTLGGIVRAAMLATPAAPLAPAMYYVVRESTYITIAYIQAGTDTKNLLNGKKVPLLKAELSDFDALTETFTSSGSDTTEKGGVNLSKENIEDVKDEAKDIGKFPISYVDFLYIKLSFVQEEKLLQRMQNLVQMNMREDQVGGTPDFELQNAKTSVLLSSEANLPYWFINVLFFGKDSDGGKMSIKKTASEHY